MWISTLSVLILSFQHSLFHALTFKKLTQTDCSWDSIGASAAVGEDSRTWSTAVAVAAEMAVADCCKHRNSLRTMEERYRTKDSEAATLQPAEVVVAACWEEAAVPTGNCH